MSEYIEYNCEYVWRGAGFDEREFIINHACDAFYKSINGDLDNNISVMWDMYQGYENTIRNFYELVHTETPLMGYVELKKHGADNYGYSPADYKKALREYKDICREYYE